MTVEQKIDMLAERRRRVYSFAAGMEEMLRASGVECEDDASPLQREALRLVRNRLDQMDIAVQNLNADVNRIEKILQESV